MQVTPFGGQRWYLHVLRLAVNLAPQATQALVSIVSQLFLSREENGGYRPLKERTGARRNGLEFVANISFVTGLPTSTRNVVSRSIRVL